MKKENNKNKPQNKSIITILLIILIVSLLIIIFLIGMYVYNNKKYTGSMVGKYVEPWGDGTYSYIILYDNGSCESGSSNLGVHGYNCTYIRTEDMIILNYYTVGGKTYHDFKYKITSDGNLEDIGGSIYYRQ